MTIYKVLIIPQGDSIAYMTSGTTLAVVRKTSEAYVFESEDKRENHNTENAAHQAAREYITKLFRSLGIEPNFIEE